MTAPEDRAPNEIDLIASMRELVLKLELQLRSGPAGSEAVTIAKQLHDMREPLAAAELRWETVASARTAGRDEGFGRGFDRGYRAGLKAGQAGGTAAGGNVVTLAGRRAISA